MSDKDSVIRIKVKGKDSGLSPSSVTVQRKIGQIPVAQLLFSGTLEEKSLVSTCIPGTELQIEAQTGKEWAPLFSGLISGQHLRLKNGERQLTIEVRDRAHALTLAPRTRFFENKKDNEICTAIIREQGLVCDIPDTGTTHEQMIQMRTTEWDFILNRLWANGLLAMVRDGAITAIKPEPRGRDLELLPDEILELESRMDAQSSFSGISAKSWDATKQAEVTGKAKNISLPVPGPLSPKKAAAVFGQNPEMVSGAGLPKAELEGWADSLMRQGQLALNYGHIKIPGRPVETGGGLLLKNGGESVDGRSLIWGVQHDFTDGNWITEIQFGLAYLANAAASWSRPLPSLNGLWPGKVKKISGDPENGGRLKIAVPAIHNGDEGSWSRLATPDAGNKRGQVFRPEKDDEVLLGFYDGDPRHPVILGQVFSKANPAPNALKAEDERNNLKGMVTRSGIELLFDDDRKEITLKTPGGNAFVISDKDRSVTIQDQHKNKIVMAQNGITIDSARDITLNAKGNITFNATQRLKAEGLSVEMKGKTSLKAEGAMAELNGQAMTTIKGGLVKIN